jgi:alanine dehydrogenase
MVTPRNGAEGGDNRVDARGEVTTRFFDAADLEAHVTQELALQAMEEAFSLESARRTVLPNRLDVPSGNGFIRVMPGVLDDVMGVKVMTLARELGTRYVVLLHDVSSGALMGIFDADEMTRFRTGATTALAARYMVRDVPTTIGLLGSGFEAVGQVRALAALWPLEEVVSFSPNPQRRARFAEAMTDELGIKVCAVDSCAAALREQRVVVLATKSAEPVLDGASLLPGAVVLSIGSTRPDLRELDPATFGRAGSLVCDDPMQLPKESGDVADALARGVLDPYRFVSLADLSAGNASLEVDEAHDLLVFKSVGTALQDLAIARAIYRADDGRGGSDLGMVASLKPFAETE